jgi:hypothetical protein
MIPSWEGAPSDKSIPALAAKCSTRKACHVAPPGFLQRQAQRYWASVLINRIVVTTVRIKVPTPELQLDARWDFSAVATITRNLAECHLWDSLGGPLFRCFFIASQFLGQPGHRPCVLRRPIRQSMNLEPLWQAPRRLAGVRRGSG